MLMTAGLSTGLLASRRAITTSLPAIYAISVAISSHLLGGRTVPIIGAAWFVAGGGARLFAGKALGHKLSGPRLQKVFAYGLLAVAAFILVRTVV